jgi:hypothetical protein
MRLIRCSSSGSAIEEREARIHLIGVKSIDQNARNELAAFWPVSNQGNRPRIAFGIGMVLSQVFCESENDWHYRRTAVR